MSDRQSWLSNTIEASPTAASTIGVSSTCAAAERRGLLTDGPLGDHGGPGPTELGTTLGLAVAELHSLPADDCPYQASAQSMIADLRLDTIDDSSLSTLPEPYSRYSGNDLLNLVEQQLELAAPSADDLVVIHGDLRPGNLWSTTDGGSQPGVLFGGLGRLGVGDRHWDLAVIHRYLPGIVGAEALFAFYDAYQTQPNLVQLDAFVLLSLLVECFDSGTVDA